MESRVNRSRLEPGSLHRNVTRIFRRKPIALSSSWADTAAIMTTAQPRSPFKSTLDRTILGAHAVVAGIFGIVGFLQATDPGWQALQRIVIIMIVGFWGMGIFVSALVSQRFSRQWIRVLVLLAGPLLALLLVFSRAIFTG